MKVVKEFILYLNCGNVNYNIYFNIPAPLYILNKLQTKSSGYSPQGIALDVIFKCLHSTKTIDPSNHSMSVNTI
jgi:hypothetical protein